VVERIRDPGSAVIMSAYALVERDRTHKMKMAKYGIEFTTPTIHWFVAQSPGFELHIGPSSGTPRSVGQDRLAPFEPS
jgi:hypothetical protein